MNDLIIQLLDIADRADSNNDIDLARKLDIYAKYLLQIKTAQYVGSQGYAVRNSRCWSNCYRVKRANHPTISAHEAWKSCHEEYVDSINDDGSKWDKYAYSKNVIKTASKNSDTINYHIKFARSITDSINNGNTINYAVMNSLQNLEVYLGKEVNILSKNLRKVASEASDSYSGDIRIVVDGLQKLSQGFMANLGKAVGQFGRAVGQFGRGAFDVLTGTKPELMTGYGYGYGYDERSIENDPKTSQCSNILLNKINSAKTPADKQKIFDSMIKNIRIYFDKEIKKLQTAASKDAKIAGVTKNVEQYFDNEAKQRINFLTQVKNNLNNPSASNIVLEVQNACKRYCGMRGFVSKSYKQQKLPLQPEVIT